MLSLPIHYEYFIKKYIPYKANVYEFFYPEMFTKPVFHFLTNFLNQFY